MCVSTAWQRLTLRDGEKGELTTEYLHAPVWVWDGSEDKTHCWHLLVRREVGASEISHYCLANAPLNTSLKELARVQAQRFFIEHSFREAKSECGMADYQGRKQWYMLSCNDLVTALAHHAASQGERTRELIVPGGGGNFGYPSCGVPEGI